MIGFVQQVISTAGQFGSAVRSLADIKNGLAILLVCFTVTGCGFQLKQASYIPEDLRVLHLTGDDQKSALYEQLKYELQRSKVTLNDQIDGQNTKFTAELHLYQDELNRQTLSLFQNGQVAQYELAYKVSYRLARPDQDPIEQSFELYRNYQDDPTNSLAKSKELEIILTEMRKLATKRIIRELSQL
ncbi:LPS assembly lipoprotein LptE [Pseudoalteromonas luteoviolacea]|uniref:LPS-assembly lipoprotein LptE n=1 Tax=Pseudoalteromonas luteoviolacea TaxID=43657 RepID=UPI0006901510|nr:LPS assembly lipoprotein LptE [Pseudoalteromonas luteoviolacea]